MTLSLFFLHLIQLTFGGLSKDMIHI